MRKTSAREAKPLTEVKLACGHWIGFRHKPSLNDVVCCEQCSRDLHKSVYQSVVSITKFFGDCWNCDWYQPFTSEDRARRTAEHHAMTFQHRTKILGNNLELVEFDYTEEGMSSVAVEQLMIDSVLTQQQHER